MRSLSEITLDIRAAQKEADLYFNKLKQLWDEYYCVYKHEFEKRNVLRNGDFIRNRYGKLFLYLNIVWRDGCFKLIVSPVKSDGSLSGFTTTYPLDDFYDGACKALNDGDDYKLV